MFTTNAKGKLGSCMHHFSANLLAVLFLLTVGTAGLVPGQSWAFEDGQEKHFDGGGACSATSRAAFKACGNEVQDDYWIAVGNCVNLADPGAVRACLSDAKEELKETKEMCKEQLEARLEVCDGLGEAPYAPQIDPAEFVDFQAVLEDVATLAANRYFPLVPGTTKIYLVKDAAGNKLERIKVEVLAETKEVLGVNCIVVRDRVWEFDDDGEEKTLIEDTDDWYAQDLDGNVWYFGEISKNYEDGELVDVEGSWKAGREMAAPGILMPAYPQEGDLYRQEFSLGNAEDMGQVVQFLDEIMVNGITYSAVLQTKDFTPIEPDAYEFKYYAPGIGVVLEENPENGEQVELKKIITP